MLATKESKSGFLSSDDSIIELSLMMPRPQFEALQQRARAEGMSVAQFLRRVIQDLVVEPEELPLGYPD